MTSPYAGSYSVVLEEVKADASRLFEASFRHEIERQILRLIDQLVFLFPVVWDVRFGSSSPLMVFVLQTVY